MRATKLVITVKQLSCFTVITKTPETEITNTTI